VVQGVAPSIGRGNEMAVVDIPMKLINHFLTNKKACNLIGSLSFNHVYSRTFKIANFLALEIFLFLFQL